MGRTHQICNLTSFRTNLLFPQENWKEIVSKKIYFGTEFAYVKTSSFQRVDTSSLFTPVTKLKKNIANG